MKIRKIKRYGWRPDTPDFRDKVYSLPKSPVKLETTHNREKYIMPEVFDQGNLGSCTGNGINSVVAFLCLNGHVKNRASEKAIPFSRLFTYYNERVIEGTVNEDAGAEIRDGIKTLAQLGVCSEKKHPYLISKFTKKPNKTSYTEALRFKALEYVRLNNADLYQLVDCLAKGFPIVFGFAVYESFESRKVETTGIVPMPRPTESLLGGHCVYAIDYDFEMGGFWCVNSWGKGWGVGGQFFMPTPYITNPNLADDFWTIRMIK